MRGWLRTQLRQRLPDRFTVSTGFVIAANGAKSKQLDVLVWDSLEHAPLFSDGEFVLVAPEAVRAVIEVKGCLDHKELADALWNLDSIVPLVDAMRPSRPVFTALFAFDIAPEVRFPGTIWNALHAYYEERSEMAVATRVAWSASPHKHPAQPWVDVIAVMGQGVVRWTRTSGGNPMIAYQALATDGMFEDTYGFVERSLLISLLTDGNADLLKHSHPGAYVHLMASNARVPEPSLMPIPASSAWPALLTNAGLSEATVRYKPRKPRKAKEEKDVADAIAKVVEYAFKGSQFAGLSDEDRAEYLAAVRAAIQPKNLKA